MAVSFFETVTETAQAINGQRRMSREAYLYWSRIRHAGKREYCARILRWWGSGNVGPEPEWHDLGLSYMGAQSVRIALSQLGIR